MLLGERQQQEGRCSDSSTRRSGSSRNRNGRRRRSSSSRESGSDSSRERGSGSSGESGSSSRAERSLRRGRRKRRKILTDGREETQEKMGNAHPHVQQIAQQQQLTPENSSAGGVRGCSGSGAGSAAGDYHLINSDDMHRSGRSGSSLQVGGLQQERGYFHQSSSSSSTQATATPPHSSYPTSVSTATGSKDVSQYTGTTMYRRLERERVQLEADAFEGLVFIIPVEYQTDSNKAAATGGARTAVEPGSHQTMHNSLSDTTGTAAAAAPLSSAQSPNAAAAAARAAGGSSFLSSSAASSSSGSSTSSSSSSPSGSTSSPSSSSSSGSTSRGSSTRERVLRALPPSICNYSVTGDAAHDGFTWLLGLEGAPNTIYEGEVFLLKFNFSPKYPIEAPEVTFLLPYLPQHPHVYSNGHICLSILYDFWSPALSVSSCGMSLLSMLSSNRSKSRPPDDDIYCKLWTSRSPKQVKWIFHDDQV